MDDEGNSRNGLVGNTDSSAEDSGLDDFDDYVEHQPFNAGWNSRGSKRLTAGGSSSDPLAEYPPAVRAILQPLKAAGDAIRMSLRYLTVGPEAQQALAANESTPLLGKRTGAGRSTSSDVEGGRQSSGSSDVDVAATSDNLEEWKKFLWLLFTKGPKAVIKPSGTKEPWQWYHAWTHVGSNLKEIFIRERESELNCLDGVRALAYFWYVLGHALLFDL
jgi:hypothetical protein